MYSLSAVESFHVCIMLLKMYTQVTCSSFEGPNTSVHGSYTEGRGRTDSE